MSSPNSKNQQAVIFSICLLIAIFFWTITALNKTFTASVSIPVVYKNIPLSFQMQKPLPAAISLDIEAKGFDLMSNNFIKKNKELTVDFNSQDLRNSDLKTHTSIATEKLLKQLISAPDPAYRVVRIAPDSILMDYSKKFTRKIPVKLNVELNFRKQFFNSGQPILKPDSLELAGPEEEIKKISSIETEKITFNNINQNLFFSAPVVNPGNDKIILAAKKVWVFIPVREFTEGKVTIAMRKIYYQNKPVTLIPDKISITYHASLKTFSQIGADDFEVEIDQAARSLENNGNKLQVKIVKFPKGAQIISVQPELVDYLIEK
ncbi:MAG: CdaR family protein [Bacteroidia bacterium]